MFVVARLPSLLGDLILQRHPGVPQAHPRIVEIHVRQGLQSRSFCFRPLDHEILLPHVLLEILIVHHHHLRTGS